MQTPVAPLALQLSGGGAPLELDELLLDELDELLLDELDELLLDELDDPALAANAWRSWSVPLNTSRSVWPLVPGELPVPVYCQKDHEVHGVGIVGQAVV